MLEDFWLPRREGGRGTEITTLPGGQNLGELKDVEYFKKKLYNSLNLPPSRLTDESKGFNLGKSTEVLRDELKFTKFIGRLRKRFGELFHTNAVIVGDSALTAAFASSFQKGPIGEIVSISSEKQLVKERTSGTFPFAARHLVFMTYLNTVTDKGDIYIRFILYYR